MTRHTSDDRDFQEPCNGPGLSNEKVTFRSVSCIFDNPLLLHRLCRYLEQDGGTFVEISYSVEDALHLMTYVSFDVVITDVTVWEDVPNGLVKVLHSRNMAVPVIYYTRNQDVALEADGKKYNGVYYVTWGTASALPEFGDLIRLISAIIPLATPPRR